MASAQLKVLERFSVNGVDYDADTLIPMAKTAGWPEGSLARRLENGFVVYVSSEDAPEPKKDK